MPRSLTACTVNTGAHILKYEGMFFEISEANVRKKRGPLENMPGPFCLADTRSPRQRRPYTVNL